MVPYVVKSGEYLLKIAHARGFDADEVWNDPKNADLKTLRQDPNILAAGDVLYIPQKRESPLPLSGGSENQYVAKIPTIPVSIQFKDAGLTGSKFSENPSGTASSELPVWTDSYRAHKSDWA